MTTPTDVPLFHRLVLLAERVTPGRRAGERDLAELVELLPGFTARSPEETLFLAGLYQRHGPRLGGWRPPSWRGAELPPSVRIALLRAELLNDPGLLAEVPPGELLYQAVGGADLTSAPHRPARLVAALTDSGDPVLRAEGLRLARQGLHAGLLAPTPVRERLAALLAGGSADVAAAALAELARPWAALHPLPHGLLTPFLDAGAAAAHPVAAAAALAAAARHGHGDLLRQTAGNPGLPPPLRRQAMELLGDVAERGDIAELTAVAAQDPLLLGGPAVTCLRGLHRRGHFADERAVRAVVALALADHTIAPAEIATVLYTCRRAMLRTLLDAAAGHPSWPRRLALLVALAAQGPGDLPIGAEITRLLPPAPDPGPFLHAIRELRHADAEEAVIALLPAAPAAALNALEAIGGARTAAALAEGLGLSADAPPDGAGSVIAPHLRAVRDRALELLWHLSHEPHARQRILVRLDPADLPARIATDLGAPDERELALLRSHLDPARPVDALCRLAAHGSTGTLPLITDLLLAAVRDLAASREPHRAPERAGGESPTGEPVVPQEVVDALYALGCRLHQRGKIRPSCLLDAPGAPEAGHALVAAVALDLLDRPGLSGGEQSILLELLLRAPAGRTRPRVHRLLRSRDPQVRKRVIALLAQDPTGDGPQALSATLITLTAAQDVQTVRQALLALGHAGATWACAAIASCLDHPNMNVKKTAAEALVRAGTPAAAPALLRWLGRHDNPGLRAALADALRAVLGDAYAATLLAAAERAEDTRTRDLLLAGLDGALPAHSVLALEGQRFPAAQALLALVQAGRVRLASGTAEDLAPTHADGRTAVPEPGPDRREADADAMTLLTGGWDPSVARRIARRPEPPSPARLRELRPMLADWLRLAGSAPTVRSRVLRFTLRLCPQPWADGERAVFARYATVLLDGLADPAGGNGHDLVTLLEAVVPDLPTVGRLAAADAVRALPAGAMSGRSTLPLLRRCGAVPVRADLDRALAEVRLGADPWQAETAVLRDAFAVPPPSAARTGAGDGPSEAWRAALRAAVRSPGALEAFRRRAGNGAPGSRGVLAGLIDAYTSADPKVRVALLDWMTCLQPLDAPPWTVGESAAAPAGTQRVVRVEDLDQPRSGAQRERLLAMLESDDPERRDAAARALSTWPEPATARHVLRAFLSGRVTVAPTAGHARELNAMSETELRSAGIRPDRVVRAVRLLDDPGDRSRLLPLLLNWWEHGPPSLRPEVRRALGDIPADTLAAALTDRLEAGASGFLDLLAGRPLLSTPALVRVRRRLRAEGRDDLAGELLLVGGPLRGADAERHDAAAVAELRERATSPRSASPRPSRAELRAELLDLARTGSPEGIRRALTRLAEEHPGPDPDEDPELRAVIGTLLKDPRPGVRLHAHRTSRAMLDRTAYLHHTAVLLDDPQPDVARMAIRTLCHAHWEPAVPAVVGLLQHAHPVVRRAAGEGLALMPGPAATALRRAAGHARPDRRRLYEDVLQRIVTSTGGG
ncbi:HEAT repeat domain-containing protein [Streptomyces agglomeratus]|uniref:HEAT repeat domain-containing protein n=1 Tax=Streptomyces agglomeratus TaxID=285458 RepID=UPI00114CB00F|nr:HEAT repeat domain-containing protein [Streptomyces agglomeratus]